MARQNGVRQGLSRARAVATPETIPDKLCFRIGEVARICAVPSYVLRFWEREFPQLRPAKGGTGQRLYRRRDVEMALRVRSLLYDEGYTIPGARQWLREAGRGTEDLAAKIGGTADHRASADQGRLREMRAELEEIVHMLAGAGTDTGADIKGRRMPEARQRVHRPARCGSETASMPLFALLEDPDEKERGR